MNPVALHIVTDVSYVTKIDYESHFAWQAYHVVTLVTNACFVVQGVVPE